MTIQKTHYSLIQEALNTTFGMSLNQTPEKLALRAAAWAEYDELFKGWFLSKNFWQPIEECPKEDMKDYFIAIKYRNFIHIGCWRECDKAWCLRNGMRLEDCEIFYFAEIPYLPKDEAKL